MKLAAIDIGSNSVHMVVAEIEGDGRFEILARHKEMVRLGARSLAEGFLSDEAQERGLVALRAFGKIAEGFGVTDVVAYATSAVREARNGQAFIERVRAEAGIYARIIEGVEEGRLIYLGVREVFNFGSRKALIIDIGGGSVEIVLADQRREYVVYSLKLGVRRLHEEFLPNDPPTPEDLEELRSHIRARAEFVVRQVRRRGFDVVLASSGTARVLARIAAAKSSGVAGQVSRESLQTTVGLLAGFTASERAKLEGVDDRRRDAILEGGMLLLTLIETFGATGFEYCDSALREGMIIDYLERNRPGLRMMDAIPEPRRRSVVMFARRLCGSVSHGEQVARIATRLFDDLADLHQMGALCRDLLEYAALLHEVGRAVSTSSYHKHTLYIIEHADLLGFSNREVAIMANVARYHRRSIPRARHADFMALDQDDRDVVIKLSTLLRLAAALDWGRQGNVLALQCAYDDEEIRVAIHTHGSADLELHAAQRKGHHVLRVFGRTLEVVEQPELPPLCEVSA